MAQQDLGTLDDYEDAPQDSLGTLDDYEDVKPVSMRQGKWALSGGPDDSASEEDKASYVLTRAVSNPTNYTSTEGQEGIAFDEAKALEEIGEELQKWGVKNMGAKQLLDMIKSDGTPTTDAEYRRMMQDLTSEAKASGAITKGNYLAPNFTAGSDKGSLIGKAANFITDVAQGPAKLAIAGAQILNTPLDVVRQASNRLGAEPEESAQPFVPPDVAMEAAKPDWMAEHGTAREIGSFITPGFNAEWVALPLLKGLRSMGNQYAKQSRTWDKLEDILSNSGAVTNKARQDIMLEAEKAAREIRRLAAKAGDGEAVKQVNTLWQKAKPMFIKQFAQQAPLVGAQMTKDITTPEFSKEKVAGDVLGAGLGLGVGTGVGLWADRLFGKEAAEGLRLGLESMSKNKNVAQGGNGVWNEKTLVPDMKRKGASILNLLKQVRQKGQQYLEEGTTTDAQSYREMLNWLKGEKEKDMLVPDEKKWSKSTKEAAEKLGAAYDDAIADTQQKLDALAPPEPLQKITPFNLTSNAEGLGIEPPVVAPITPADPSTLPNPMLQMEKNASNLTKESGQYKGTQLSIADMQNANAQAKIAAKSRVWLSSKNYDYKTMQTLTRMIDELQNMSPFSTKLASEVGGDMDLSQQILAYAHKHRYNKTQGTATLLTDLTNAGKQIKTQLDAHGIETPSWLTDDAAMEQFAKDLDAISDYDKLRRKLGPSGEPQSLLKDKNMGYQTLALLAMMAKQGSKGVAQRPEEPLKNTKEMFNKFFGK